MDRVLIWPGAVPLETDLLQAQVNAMAGLGALARATLGTTTSVDGLTLAATAPAGMSLVVSPGSITQLSTVDATAFSSVASNSAPLVKTGINLTPTTLSFTAPAGAGTSQNFLIQATLAETDGGSTALAYYNASNPAVAFSGPANSGTPQYTKRAQTVTISVVSGAPANTGTQTTPAVTAGYVPLYVVTVANGQTTITSANFSIAANAPFTDGYGLGLGTRPGRLIGVSSWGAAGTYTYTRSTSARYGILLMVGGGGAGGGAPATSSGQYSCGGGGGSGAFAIKILTSLPATASVTVGAGGVASAGGVGGNGSASSFAGTYVANGGFGGGTAGPSAAGFLATSGNGGTKGATADIESGGNPGVYGITVGSTALGGYGAASQMFSGAGFGAGNQNGGNATGPGCSGGGSACGPSTSAFAGGTGGSGFVLLYEYT